MNFKRPRTVDMWEEFENSFDARIERFVHRTKRFLRWYTLRFSAALHEIEYHGRDLSHPRFTA